MFVGLITFGASVSVYDLTQSGKAVCDVIAGNHSLEVDAMQVSCRFCMLRLSIAKHALSLLCATTASRPGTATLALICRGYPSHFLLKCLRIIHCYCPATAWGSLQDV